jgi:hypothetical protein
LVSLNYFTKPFYYDNAKKWKPSVTHANSEQNMRIKIKVNIFNNHQLHEDVIQCYKSNRWIEKYAQSNIRQKEADGFWFEHG